MKAKKIIYSIAEKGFPGNTGNKARNLRLLSQKGFLVPETFVCSWDAYERYLKDDISLIEALRAELKPILKADQSYAIRSSANFEDSLERSFAGQFKSVLHARGLDEVLASIWSIWASSQSAGVNAYLAKSTGSAPAIRMAVMIQPMVLAAFSGVSFSKNPITGLDEVVVEAVCGSGEQLVQEGVTPSRWVKRRDWWVERPAQAAIPESLIEQVVAETRAISRVFKKDVDLEWAFDGQQLYWLQMREITVLQQAKVYSNRLAREMLPGAIMPLVWSVSVPINVGAWLDLMGEMVGKHDLDPESLVKAFHYRAYFDMGAFGRLFERLGLPNESIEMMMGILPPGSTKPGFKPRLQFLFHLPRLARFAIDKWKVGSKVRTLLPELRSSYEKLASQDIDKLDVRGAIEQIDELVKVHRKVTYLNIVIPILMRIYHRIAQAQLKGLGIDAEQVDLIKGVEEIAQFDPRQKAQTIHKMLQQVDLSVREKVQTCTYEEFLALPGIEELKLQVTTFMDQFGHLSDSGNDFSKVPWRENPDLALRFILACPPPEELPVEKLGYHDLSLEGLHRWHIRLFVWRARNFRLYREWISSLYTYGIGLFRTFYRLLGERFVQSGLLDEKDDIFFLYDSEVRSIAAERLDKDCRVLVGQRKEEIRRCEGVQLPQLIYGDAPLPIASERSGRLHGTPTSKGRYTGRTRLVRGIVDFHKLSQGDVLVVPFSDVSWTPLFARAGAVIAESGGLLSHSSIVAREYGIPAVVSVSGAMSLEDDMMVSVDGFTGEITVHEDF